jgi:thiol-disulfide isomerase/thioredoxin
MQKTALALLLLVTWSAAASAAGDKPPATGIDVGQRIPAFTAPLLGPSGEPAAKELDSRRQGRVTAYIVIGTHCPATQAYTERLARLQKDYAPKQVDFVYIYPNREDTLPSKLAFHKEKNLGSRLIDDQGGRVARLLGAKRTSEVVLTDAKGTIVYRGAIDDARDAAAVKQRYLANALDETLAGKAVAVTTTPVQA